MGIKYEFIPGPYTPRGIRFKLSRIPGYGWLFGIHTRAGVRLTSLVMA